MNSQKLASEIEALQKRVREAAESVRAAEAAYRTSALEALQGGKSNRKERDAAMKSLQEARAEKDELEAALEGARLRLIQAKRKESVELAKDRLAQARELAAKREQAAVKAQEAIEALGASLKECESLAQSLGKLHYEAIPDAYGSPFDLTQYSGRLAEPLHRVLPESYKRTVRGLSMSPVKGSFAEREKEAHEAAIAALERAVETLEREVKNELVAV